jgi:hypothetical protein
MKRRPLHLLGEDLDRMLRTPEEGLCRAGVVGESDHENRTRAMKPSHHQGCVVELEAWRSEDSAKEECAGSATMSGRERLNASSAVAAGDDSQVLAPGPCSACACKQVLPIGRRDRSVSGCCCPSACMRGWNIS